MTDSVCVEVEDLSPTTAQPPSRQTRIRIRGPKVTIASNYAQLGLVGDRVDDPGHAPNGTARTKPRLEPSAARKHPELAYLPTVRVACHGTHFGLMPWLIGDSR